MCGSLSVYACRAGPTPVKGQLRYQLGRLVSYSGVGFAAGALGHAAALNLPGHWGRAVLSWSLALGLGLVAIRLWKRATPASLVSLTTKPADEKPRSQVANAFRALVRRPFLLGLATGFLPCGALAGAILIAASTQSPVLGSLSMLAFATVSSVGLAGAALLATKFLGGGRPIRSRVLSVAVGLGAIVFLIRPVNALRHEDSAADCHEHGSETSVLQSDLREDGTP